MLNGDGLRVVLRLAGCNHCCRECQNPITWDPNGGLPFTEKEEAEIFAELDKDYISGITFSGGDPLHPSNISAVTALARKIRTKYPDKTIWLYTGSRGEEIQQDKPAQSPKCQGSSNQRVINVPATLREQKIVLHAD